MTLVDAGKFAFCFKFYLAAKAAATHFISRLN
jgi:hypothetical protein